MLPPACSYIHKLCGCPKQEDSSKSQESKCSTLCSPTPSSCPVSAPFSVELWTVLLERTDRGSLNALKNLYRSIGSLIYISNPFPFGNCWSKKTWVATLESMRRKVHQLWCWQDVQNFIYYICFIPQEINFPLCVFWSCWTLTEKKSSHWKTRHCYQGWLKHGLVLVTTVNCA